ncbi:MAG: Penicillin-binding protein, 1A family [Candidatus Jorgensenbacteria bacterium GW2011_GWA1_48_13]|uniref:Penicillin-binding protein, 1A family n=2 Tax=Candidatus Joergenseniibacteriota TaxID=1752739 RepID=A0A0G1W9P1_9BACT|nr:MAG: Penicillin-binding protein, 1A family [Candidatus Jorgensenbacteria bacterium GW2011_GWA1_48_13]KKU99060.1 MAG: Penicillin-binding protein, 1A family [Candidatus Jorgensenbacteria bacterium GW2011_GWC1_48_8]KKW15300.1 MAG: Penicillin-binding protein, 1A family [Candidatus Jorgensenbacteria bacterium GW2011_GWB1_50_10]
MRKRKNRKRLLIVLAAAMGILVSAAAAGTVYVAIIVRSLPSPYEFGERKVSQSSKLYDRSGEILLYEIHGEEKRTVIPFDEIPESLKQATLAAEDADFYNEPAFDWRAIIRALLVNLKEGRVSQGGSTITQQLAKNAFLSSEKTITRKIKELILAIQLESKYSKKEIFEFYLNQIPYGSNAYGVEAAALTFFNKQAKGLTLGEVTLLASLLKAPSYFSPWGTHTEELFERQKYVLERMTSLGYISDDERNKALQEEITFAPPSLGTIKAPHFSLAVKDYLIEKYGEDMAINGGLRVVTTLNWDMQQIAEKAVLEGAERNGELYGGENAALVAEDPKTGQVLAMVGSRDWFATLSLPLDCAPRVDCKFEPKFNVATQGLRQPGSALKPFAYLTAFKKGYLSKTIIIDAPTEFVSNDPNCPAIPDFLKENDKDCFHPQNFDDRFRGPVSFEEGLAQSINVPSVKVLYLAGFDNVLDTLHKFGITSLKERARYGLSLILGGGEVKLFDLVNAYATLSQEGVRHNQKFVLEVKDSKGSVLESWNDETERVMETEPVRVINQILSDVKLRSGLFQNSLSLTIFPDHEVALKTGTTNDYRDAWAMGYTPSLVVGVWAGNNDNAPMQRQGSSILAAVPIWNAFLKEVINKFPSETFMKPEPKTTVTKPMLNGEAVYRPIVNGRILPQLHSILYYVNKRDPLGPKPASPDEDSQFYNWETGVLNWALANITDFYSYNLPLPNDVSFLDNAYPSAGAGNITVTNVSPQNGSFVNLPVRVSADLQAVRGLSRVEISFNRRQTSNINVSGTYYHLDYYILNALEPQNLIEIKAVDLSGEEYKTTLIVFH